MSRVSYSALKSIVPLLPFTLRTSLGAKSSWVKTICDGIERPIKLVKFHQPYGRVTNAPRYEPCHHSDLTFAPVYFGVLTVDTVTWNFEYDELREEVLVTCSLYPGRKRLSSQKTLAKELFSLFMEIGVKQLELKETADPFEFIESFDCPRLRWKINGVFQGNWFNNIQHHTFDVLELVDVRNYYWMASLPHVKKAKHLIWTDEDYATRDHFFAMLFLEKRNLRNGLVHLKWRRPRNTSSFAKLCNAMITFNWKNGSFVELSYQKTRRVQRRVWTKLSVLIPNIRIVRLPNKEISVLKVTDDYVVYVEMFDEDRFRFKASKVAREDCRLDLEALDVPVQ